MGQLQDQVIQSMRQLSLADQSKDFLERFFLSGADPKINQIVLGPIIDGLEQYNIQLFLQASRLLQIPGFKLRPGDTDATILARIESLTEEGITRYADKPSQDANTCRLFLTQILNNRQLRTLLQALKDKTVLNRAHIVPLSELLVKMDQDAKYFAAVQHADPEAFRVFQILNNYAYTALIRILLDQLVYKHNLESAVEKQIVAFLDQIRRPSHLDIYERPYRGEAGPTKLKAFFNSVLAEAHRWVTAHEVHDIASSAARETLPSVMGVHDGASNQHQNRVSAQELLEVEASGRYPHLHFSIDYVRPYFDACYTKPVGEPPPRDRPRARSEERTAARNARHAAAIARFETYIATARENRRADVLPETLLDAQRQHQKILAVCSVVEEVLATELTSRDVISAEKQAQLQQIIEKISQKGLLDLVAFLAGQSEFIQGKAEPLKEAIRKRHPESVELLYSYFVDRVDLFLMTPRAAYYRQVAATLEQRSRVHEAGIAQQVQMESDRADALLACPVSVESALSSQDYRSLLPTRVYNPLRTAVTQYMPYHLADQLKILWRLKKQIDRMQVILDQGRAFSDKTSSVAMAQMYHNARQKYETLRIHRMTYERNILNAQVKLLDLVLQQELEHARADIAKLLDSHQITLVQAERAYVLLDENTSIQRLRQIAQGLENRDVLTDRQIKDLVLEVRGLIPDTGRIRYAMQCGPLDLSALVSVVKRLSDYYSDDPARITQAITKQPERIESDHYKSRLRWILNHIKRLVVLYEVLLQTFKSLVWFGKRFAAVLVEPIALLFRFFARLRQNNKILLGKSVSLIQEIHAQLAVLDTRLQEGIDARARLMTLLASVESLKDHIGRFSSKVSVLSEHLNDLENEVKAEARAHAGLGRASLSPRRAASSATRPPVSVVERTDLDRDVTSDVGSESSSPTEPGVDWFSPGAVAGVVDDLLERGDGVTEVSRRAIAGAVRRSCRTAFMAHARSTFPAHIESLVEKTKLKLQEASEVLEGLLGADSAVQTQQKAKIALLLLKVKQLKTLQADLEQSAGKLPQSTLPEVDAIAEQIRKAEQFLADPREIPLAETVQDWVLGVVAQLHTGSPGTVGAVRDGVGDLVSAVATVVGKEDWTTVDIATAVSAAAMRAVPAVLHAPLALLDKTPERAAFKAVACAGLDALVVGLQASDWTVRVVMEQAVRAATVAGTRSAASLMARGMPSVRDPDFEPDRDEAFSARYKAFSKAGSDIVLKIGMVGTAVHMVLMLVERYPALKAELDILQIFQSTREAVVQAIEAGKTPEEVSVIAKNIATAAASHALKAYWKKQQGDRRDRGVRPLLQAAHIHRGSDTSLEAQLATERAKRQTALAALEKKRATMPNGCESERIACAKIDYDIGLLRRLIAELESLSEKLKTVRAGSQALAAEIAASTTPAVAARLQHPKITVLRRQEEAIKARLGEIQCADLFTWVCDHLDRYCVGASPDQKAMVQRTMLSFVVTALESVQQGHGSWELATQLLDVFNKALPGFLEVTLGSTDERVALRTMMVAVSGALFQGIIEEQEVARIQARMLEAYNAAVPGLLEATLGSAHERVAMRRMIEAISTTVIQGMIQGHDMERIQADCKAAAVEAGVRASGPLAQAVMKSPADRSALDQAWVLKVEQTLPQVSDVLLKVYCGSMGLGQMLKLAERYPGLPIRPWMIQIAGTVQTALIAAIERDDGRDPATLEALLGTTQAVGVAALSTQVRDYLAGRGVVPFVTKEIAAAPPARPIHDRITAALETARTAVLEIQAKLTHADASLSPEQRRRLALESDQHSQRIQALLGVQMQLCTSDLDARVRKMLEAQAEGLLSPDVFTQLCDQLDLYFAGATPAQTASVERVAGSLMLAGLGSLQARDTPTHTVAKLLDVLLQGLGPILHVSAFFEDSPALKSTLERVLQALVDANHASDRPIAERRQLLSAALEQVGAELRQQMRALDGKRAFRERTLVQFVLAFVQGVVHAIPRDLEQTLEVNTLLREGLIAVFEYLAQEGVVRNLVQIPHSTVRSFVGLGDLGRDLERSVRAGARGVDRGHGRGREPGAIAYLRGHDLAGRSVALPDITSEAGLIGLKNTFWRAVHADRQTHTRGSLYRSLGIRIFPDPDAPVTPQTDYCPAAVVAGCAVATAHAASGASPPPLAPASAGVRRVISWSGGIHSMGSTTSVFSDGARRGLGSASLPRGSVAELSTSTPPDAGPGDPRRFSDLSAGSGAVGSIGAVAGTLTPPRTVSSDTTLAAPAVQSSSGPLQYLRSFWNRHGGRGARGAGGSIVSTLGTGSDPSGSTLVGTGSREGVDAGVGVAPVPAAASLRAVVV
jgi:hypothetical protein